MLDLLHLTTLVGRDIQRLADREQADGEHDHVDPVHQLRHSEREAHLTGLVVDADQPKQQAQEQHRQTADR